MFCSLFQPTWNLTQNTFNFGISIIEPSERKMYFVHIRLNFPFFKVFLVILCLRSFSFRCDFSLFLYVSFIQMSHAYKLPPRFVLYSGTALISFLDLRHVNFLCILPILLDVSCTSIIKILNDTKKMIF